MQVKAALRSHALWEHKCCVSAVSMTSKHNLFHKCSLMPGMLEMSACELSVTRWSSEEHSPASPTPARPRRTPDTQQEIMYSRQHPTVVPHC